jgi:hypothetical protein
MSRHRGTRSSVVAFTLLLVPALALAEVSVKIDPDGTYRRWMFITPRGGSVVWGQVRPNLPLEVLLNPLGDVLGDLPPVVETHPASGRPWVFWSRNVANVKELVFSTWGDAGWTAPQRIVPVAGPIPYDELDPAVVFTPDGAPYLVWWRAEDRGQVYFSTLIRGAWSPPLRLSDPAVDSRRPTILIQGTTARISFRTAAGTVTRTFETAVLVESAADLMDTPIPPGYEPPPDDAGQGDEPGLIKR